MAPCDQQPAAAPGLALDRQRREQIRGVALVEQQQLRRVGLGRKHGREPHPAQRGGEGEVQGVVAAC